MSATPRTDAFYSPDHLMSDWYDFASQLETELAAVPELLEALEWCIGQFQGESGCGESHWEAQPGYIKARVAIAKAKGGQS